MPSENSPAHRLVYGPAEYAGYQGVVLDAESAKQFSILAQAKTLGEAMPVMRSMTWEEYVSEVTSEGEDAPDFDERFEFEEWLVEGRIITPSEVAYEVAGDIVNQIIATDPVEFSRITTGGGSPGGNIDIILGPLSQLELLATRLNSGAYGFLLERDDALVDAGMARHLYP